MAQPLTNGWWWVASSGTVLSPTGNRTQLAFLTDGSLAPIRSTTGQFMSYHYDNTATIMLHSATGQLLRRWETNFYPKTWIDDQTVLGLGTPDDRSGSGPTLMNTRDGTIALISGLERPRIGLFYAPIGTIVGP